jgi:8-oxo-dGTP diphosphatase
MTSTTSATLIAIAVVRWGDWFLAGPRPEGAPLAGYWEFPGGKVEPEETPPAAAIRECLEETGLHVVVEAEYAACDHDYPHDRVRLRFFDCRPLDTAAPVRPPFRWIDRRQLAALPFPPANASLIALLQ